MIEELKNMKLHDTKKIQFTNHVSGGQDFLTAMRVESGMIYFYRQGLCFVPFSSDGEKNER